MKESRNALWRSLRCPGLTPAASKIRELVAQIPLKLEVLSYKSSRDFLWVVFIGGTGTGKSTLFNALVGSSLSETGVERPKTGGALAFSHKSIALESDFPFASMGIQRLSIDQLPPAAHSGNPDHLLVLAHSVDPFRHLVIVDTPDLDSVELKNRQTVEDLQLLADVVIFVASQEKYADEVPFRLLSRLHLGEKPYFLLLNKAQDGLTAEEVLEVLHRQGVGVGVDRFWMLPHVPSPPSVSLPGHKSFSDFRKTLLQELANAHLPRLIQTEKARAAAEVTGEIELLLDLLQKEQQAAEKWTELLEVLFEAACRSLLSELEERFAQESRAHIQREIRKHFSKYDLLGKPRRFVSQILRLPFQALGLLSKDTDQASAEDLHGLCRKADLRLIEAAVENFNRSALERLSPQDSASALYHALRDPRLVLTNEEIRQQVQVKQDQLMLWLAETFQGLAEGLPRSKELGIYSTSILWGGLIISLEAAIGGGISLLEAILNTAVAPFVTKGAVDLFAYHELQKIVRELAERYRETLTLPLETQRERYLQCLGSLTPSSGALQELAAVRRRSKPSTS
jgi:hypothetical protein